MFEIKAVAQPYRTQNHKSTIFSLIIAKFIEVILFYSLYSFEIESLLNLFLFVSYLFVIFDMIIKRMLSGYSACKICILNNYCVSTTGKTK